MTKYVQLNSAFSPVAFAPVVKSEPKAQRKARSLRAWFKSSKA